MVAIKLKKTQSAHIVEHTWSADEYDKTRLLKFSTI